MTEAVCYLYEHPDKAPQLTKMRWVHMVDQGWTETPLYPAEADQGGWIVGNGDGTKWRTWGAMGPEWTTDRNTATRYYRREDAEAVHRDDEDAWTIVPFGGKAESPPASASTEAAWCADDLPCARYTAALAARDEVWQPIETAPKDGTKILGCWVLDGPEDAFARGSYGVVQYAKNEWLDAGLAVRDPDYWQPLPSIKEKNDDA